MKLIVLLFPSVDCLLGFRLAAEPIVLNTNLEASTLFCLCSHEQLELAEYVYDAAVLQSEPSLN